MKTVILGGGISGLSCGFHLSKNGTVDILEVKDKIGGISSSFTHKDYTLDYGPHKIYTQLPHVQKEIEDLLGNELLKIKKKNSIRLFGKYFKYPVGMKDLAFGINPLISMKAGIDYGISMIFKQKEISYEDYIINKFGKTLYSLVFESYAEKVWGNPAKLDANLARTRISIPGLFTMIQNMIFKKNRPEVSAEYFFYPKSGIIELSKRYASAIEKNKGNIHLEAKPIKINIKGNKVSSIEFERNKKKEIIYCDYLISTIPLSDISNLMGMKTEPLKSRSLLLLYLIVDKDRLLKDNWIFFPEKEFIFNRISEQKGFSEFTVPKKTVLCAEITCDYDDNIWKTESKKLFETTIIDLEKAGILKNKEVEETFLLKLKDIYPLYEVGYEKKLEQTLARLEGIENFYTIGRNGLFNYNNMDHCIDMGIKTANFISSKKDKSEWKSVRKGFYKYKIVD